MRCTHYLSRVVLADGGVVRAVLDLCNALSKAGLDVTLLKKEGEDVPKEWANDTHHPRVAVLSRDSSPIIRRSDVVHLHTPWDPTNRRLARWCRSVGVPYGVSVHGMLDDWSMSQKHLKKRAYLAMTGRALLEQAAFVHCTAEAELIQARRWFGRGHGVVVPLILDLSDYKVLPGAAPARQRYASAFTENWPVVLFLSRLHPKKGADRLIRAAAKWKQAGLDARLVLAGPGEAAYRAELTSLASHLGLDKQISFVGMVSGIEKISLYQAADLLVIPTSQENFGFVFFEALAAGTPIVMTRGVDTWPELEQGGAVIVENDEDAVAKAVIQLLSDRQGLASRGQFGRSWVLTHLEPEVVARRYIAMYESARSRGQA